MSDTPPVDCPKRFRIAFSFAGEKRPFVEEVAHILADRFSEEAILYDKFHEAEFARHDLGIYLPKLYGEQSDLIVPVLCPDYDRKRWTGWEWLHIYGLLTKAGGASVMPSRFELANADGLSPAAGFIELDDKKPEQFARLILQRLALNEDKPKDYYTKSAIADSPPLLSSTPSFPSTPPEISWPLADGLEVRRAVEGVLCAESEHRIVLVRGESGRGKTQACRVLGQLGMQFEWLRCGRLDLKGTSELGPAVHNFITDLRAEKHLPTSPSGGALDRISGLIAALDRASQPTLLVFDTFEAGGEFSRWVEDRVFPAVKQHEWLRVVVAGQEVPAFAAATCRVPALPVTLKCIPVVDWIEFGQRYKKDLPQHEVETLYKVAGDNHTLMQGYVLKLCEA
jgi:hypothetical protein